MLEVYIALAGFQLAGRGVPLSGTRPDIDSSKDKPLAPPEAFAAQRNTRAPVCLAVPGARCTTPLIFEEEKAGVRHLGLKTSSLRKAKPPQRCSQAAIGRKRSFREGFCVSMMSQSQGPQGKGATATLLHLRRRAHGHAASRPDPASNWLTVRGNYAWSDVEAGLMASRNICACWRRHPPAGGP